MSSIYFFQGHTIILLIDISNDIERMSRVKNAVALVDRWIRRFFGDNDKTRFVVLYFSSDHSSGAMNEKGYGDLLPIKRDQYELVDIDGEGDFKSALKELRVQLSDGILRNTSFFKHTIFLFSEGCSVNSWISELQKLEDISEFTRARKYAISAGEVDEYALTRFVGHERNIISMRQEPCFIEKMIEAIYGMYVSCGEDHYEYYPKKLYPVFFVIDNSDSMVSDGVINSVNATIEEIIYVLRDVSVENNEIDLRVAALASSPCCHWLTQDTNGNPYLDSLDPFFLSHLEVGGIADMGAIFTEFESKLSRKQFFQNNVGVCALTIILFSVGNPTNGWQEGLEKLKHNNYYKYARKIAITAGSANKDMLVEFTGSDESVFTIEDISSRGGDFLKPILSRLVFLDDELIEDEAIEAEYNNIDVPVTLQSPFADDDW